MSILAKMVPVSTAKPCPICKKPDWCLIAPDGSAAICSRTESAKRCGDAGWLHYLGDPETRVTSKPAKRSKPSKLLNWLTDAERYAEKLAGLPACRELLASRLGLPVAALDAIPLLGIRHDTPDVFAEFTIPETDAEGTIIGLSTRAESEDAKAVKKFVIGGKRGLTLPIDFRNRSGPIFVVEGPTDFLAMTAAGLHAIGRPSCTGGGKLLAELFAEWQGEVVIVGENDRKTNGDWPGRTGAQSLATLLASKLGRPVKCTMPPDGVKDVREWLTAEERGETPWLQRGDELALILSGTMTSVEPDEIGGDGATPVRRQIIVDTDEFRVNDEACAALASEPDLYQRGGQLVAVVERCDEATSEARIRPLTPILLRERLTRCAQFVQRRATKEGDVVERKEHPKPWCAGAVFDRGHWPVPHLRAIVTHPAFIQDGSLLSKPGYDPDSRLFLSLEANLDVNVPVNPSRADVARAVATLEDVLFDFPFETPAHKSAWFAGLLTPLAWFAFDGPAPFFLIDGNTRGVGKGLLADVIAFIVFGRRFSPMTYTNDCEELRKKITTLAMGGERAVQLDNLSGVVGNAVFDAALTSVSWQDRILGGNRNFDGPLNITWFGTGNNVQLGADTSRRVCQIRLETPAENPELKGDFRHEKLRGYVRQHRGKLLTAALTILRGWHVSGRPTHNLPNWGSFEEWSGIVREAIVFAGLTDPGETREELQRSSDRDAAGMRTILEEMERLDPQRHGSTAADLIGRCQVDPTANAELRGAIEELCGKLDSRKLGGKFRHFQRRNFGGKMLDKSGTDRTKTSRWAVFNVGPSSVPLPPDAGDAGDAGSIPGEDPAPLGKEEVARRRAAALKEAQQKISEGRHFHNSPCELPD